MTDVMDRRTCLIFSFFCLGVQIFMAYNAGATTGSIEIIQKGDPKNGETGWSTEDIGILGGMDKFGMTISSPIWGYILQFVEAKTAITAGLLCNGVATLLFGFTRDHTLMLSAKFLMGISEGLQWVWSQIWITAKAGGFPLFLNLNGVSAGAGTVVGTAISGFSTAHGFTYAFAFKVEGTVLLVLWLALVWMRKRDLSIREKSNAQTTQRKPYREVLRSLCKNQIYLNTAIVFAFDNFVVLGTQFLWTRIFMSIWKVSKDEATTTLILVPVIGSAIGAGVGSAWPFQSNLEKKSTLKKCTVAALVSLVSAGVAWLGIAVEVNNQYFQWNLPPWATLFMTYGGFTFVSAGLTAEMGAVVGISTDSVTDEGERSIAVGFQQGANNFFGLTLAPFVPQVAMAIFQNIMKLPATDKDGLDPPILILVGITATLLGTVVVFVNCFLAYCAARSLVTQEKETPLLTST